MTDERTSRHDERRQDRAAHSSDRPRDAADPDISDEERRERIGSAGGGAYDRDVPVDHEGRT